MLIKKIENKKSYSIIKKRFCIDCKKDINDRENRSKRCKDCQNKYRIQYKQNWWKENKDRYKDRPIGELGTNDTITYEKWKNNGYKKKYKALKDEEFSTNNEAYTRSVYVNDTVGYISSYKIIAEADKYRWITPEKKGFYWDLKCCDWVTENPKFFFTLQLSDDDNNKKKHKKKFR